MTNISDYQPDDDGITLDDVDPAEIANPFDRSHGSLFDRGGADSYYRRGRKPHYGGSGGPFGWTPTEVTDPKAVAEYNAGFDANEAAQDFKEWN